ISYAPGSRTTYDGLGRVLKSEALTEFGIELVREEPGNAAAGYKTRVRKNTQGALVGRDIASPSLVLSSTTTQYDAVGRTLRTTGSLGNYRRYEYFDEPAATNVFAGGPGATEVLLSTTTYDLAGNQQKVVTNGDRLTEYKYDALNRQTEVWFPAVNGVIAKTVTEYDALGRRKAFTDEENKITRFEYDGLGRLTKVIDADAKATEFGYDELGNLVLQKDALQRITRFDYDNFGRRIKRQLPRGEVETVSYDPWDATRALFLNRKTHTDFNSKTSTHDNDVRGRLVKKTPHSSFGSSSTVFRYTPAGQRRTITDPSGTTTFIYGRLKPDGTFAYDSDRLLVKNHTYAGAITYDFDSRGNISRIDATKSYTLSYDTTTATYRASVAATDANRTLLTYSYDFQGRLSEVRTGSPGTLVAKYDFYSDGTLQKLRYAQAGVGVAFNGIRQDALAHTFNYDARHRLTD
ncbi:MAG: hypothetical protein Q7R41_14235, partial [Phycisphaerales bacterium]|nr:hypothetical protein [Phycisphaerales bacterium]